MALVTEGAHHKLAHEHSTGTWEFDKVPISGTRYGVAMNER